MLKNGHALKKLQFEEVDAWKYVILAGFVIILGSSLMHFTTFGIIYGGMLARIGNEAQDTSTINSIFTMMLLSTGVPVRQLLKKVSCRKVAYLGAFMFCVGSFVSAFAESPIQLMFTLGILQGGGIGCLLVPTFAAFVEYFANKRNFYINLAHFILSIVAISFPAVSIFCINNFGDKLTILLKSAVTSHVIVAATCLHPVRWHVRRKEQTAIELKIIHSSNSTLSDTTEDSPAPSKEPEVYYEHETKKDNASSLSPCRRWCQRACKTFDLQLFKDPSFVNTAIGCAVAQISEFMYISFLPLLLTNAGFSKPDMSLLITIHVISDLVGKTFLCVLTAIVRIQCRHLILIGTTSVCIFLLALNHRFVLTALSCSVLGFARPFIGNSIVVVSAEMYPNKFVPVFSLSMLVSACMSLLLGQIIRVFTGFIEDKAVALIILSIMTGCCVVAWTIELTYKHLTKNAKE